MWSKYHHAYGSTWPVEHARHLVRRVYTVMALAHVALGVVIIVGGEERFTGRSYVALMDLIRGHVWAWGAWSLLAAALMLVPRVWTQIAGLIVGMAWSVLMSILVITAVLTYPDAATVTSVGWVALTMVHANLFTSKVTHLLYLRGRDE